MSMKKTIAVMLIKQAVKQPVIRKFVARKIAKRSLRPLTLVGAGAALALAIGASRRRRA